MPVAPIAQFKKAEGLMPVAPIAQFKKAAATRTHLSKRGSFFINASCTNFPNCRKKVAASRAEKPKKVQNVFTCWFPSL